MSKAIVGSKVFVGPGRPAIEEGVVLVEEDRIVSVGPEGSVEVPPEAERIEGKDWFVMPGLIDGHQHLGDADPSEPGLDFLKERERETRGEVTPQELMLEAVRHGAMQLRDGVTTLRIVGEADFIDLYYREAFDAGRLPGPRIVLAGPAITPSHGHGQFVSVIADGVAGVRQAVRRNLRRGVDLIKLMVTGGGASTPDTCYYSLDEIKAVVDEAHSYEKTVAAHVIGGIAGKYCIDAGVDAIEHGMDLSRSDFRSAAERGIWIVMTNTWLVDFETDLWDYTFERVQKTVALMREEGARLAVGADCYHWDHAFVRELEILVDCGFSTEEALTMGTLTNAELSGVDATRGTLEPGKLADIIAVQGDPLANISDLRNTELVMKGGTVYDLNDFLTRV